MIKNKERLRALERQFRVEDPEFTGSFDTRVRHLYREHRKRGSLRIGIVAATLLGASCFWSGRPVALWRSPPRSD